jgi:hypothetical protein
MGRVKMAYRLTMAFHKREALLVFGVTNSLHFNKEKVISPLNIRPDSGGRKETGWVHMQQKRRNERQRELRNFGHTNFK